MSTVKAWTKHPTMETATLMGSKDAVTMMLAMQPARMSLAVCIASFTGTALFSTYHRSSAVLHVCPAHALISFLTIFILQESSALCEKKDTILELFDR